jgi:hypothetical protein
MELPVTFSSATTSSLPGQAMAHKGGNVVFGEQRAQTGRQEVYILLSIVKELVCLLRGWNACGLCQGLPIFFHAGTLITFLIQATNMTSAHKSQPKHQSIIDADIALQMVNRSLWLPCTSHHAHIALQNLPLSWNQAWYTLERAFNSKDTTKKSA